MDLQEDFNVLKCVLFGYYINKLWIFEVWSIASPKMWVDSTKIVIKHDLQLLYIFGLLQCVFSTPLHAYFLEMGKSRFLESYLSVQILWVMMLFCSSFAVMCQRVGLITSTLISPCLSATDASHWPALSRSDLDCVWLQREQGLSRKLPAFSTINMIVSRGASPEPSRPSTENFRSLLTSA